MTNNIIDSRIITEAERKIIVQLFVDLIRHNANKTQMVGFCFATWDRQGNVSTYSKSLIETDMDIVLEEIAAEMEMDSQDNSYLPDRFK